MGDPHAGIKQVRIGAQGRQAGAGARMARQQDQAVHARALVDEGGKPLALALQGRADAGRCVHRNTQLMQRCIVRDGTQRCRSCWSAAALLLARAGAHDETAGEGAEQASVIGIAKQPLMPGTQGTVEVPDKVRARIEGVGEFARGRGEAAGAPGGIACLGKLRRGEMQESVAALEAHLMDQRHAARGCAGAGPGRQQVVEALFETARPTAPAHGFAVCVENQKADIRLARCESSDDQVMDPFDRHRGGDLADETPRVRETELDRQVSALLHIGEEFRLFQQALDKAATGLKCFRCLEQGRDVQLSVHTVLPGEIKRAHHGGGVLTLGNQEADHRSGIDMLEKLRAHHELTPRGRLFAEEVREVHGQRL